MSPVRFAVVATVQEPGMEVHEELERAIGTGQEAEAKWCGKSSV